jgi:hypothetical protein
MVGVWSTRRKLARNRHLGSVGLRLRPDGESDIIWNLGLELTRLPMRSTASQKLPSFLQN